MMLLHCRTNPPPQMNNHSGDKIKVLVGRLFPNPPTATLSHRGKKMTEQYKSLHWQCCAEGEPRFYNCFFGILFIAVFNRSHPEKLYGMSRALYWHYRIYPKVRIWYINVKLKHNWTLQKLNRREICEALQMCKAKCQSRYWGWRVESTRLIHN